jgi:hypothetical protein
LAEIGPVVLLNTPVLADVTFTEMKHDPADGPRGADDTRIRRGAKGMAGASDPPVRVMAPEPTAAVTVPPQSLLVTPGAATTKPAGKLSVNAIPVRLTSLFGGVELLLGLLMVKLTNDVPFCTV